jgi:hypothetical protein
MLSKAKHLEFSSGYEVEILRLPPQNDIATQSPLAGENERGGERSSYGKERKGRKEEGTNHQGHEVGKIRISKFTL